MGGAGPSPAPVLETERLILRGFVPGDFDAHYAILAKPEVNAFLGPVQSREDLWRRTLSSVGMWPLLGYGGWMVERRDDQRLLGNVGLFDARRGIGWDGQPEMGWIFDSDVHGQGFAGEACGAVTAWADANLSDKTLWAMISPGNDGSHRLAKKLGFAIVDRRDYHDEPVDILSRPIGR